MVTSAILWVMSTREVGDHVGSGGIVAVAGGACRAAADAERGAGAGAGGVEPGDGAGAVVRPDDGGPGVGDGERGAARDRPATAARMVPRGGTEAREQAAGGGGGAVLPGVAGLHRGQLVRAAVGAGDGCHDPGRPVRGARDQRGVSRLRGAGRLVGAAGRAEAG